MLIDFTEEELLVIGKLLAYVAYNPTANSVMEKVETYLGYEISQNDWKDVKFCYEDSGKEVSDFHLYIKIEESV